MKNLTKICCLLLNLSFCAYAEEAQVIDLKNESQVVNPQVNEASSQTSPYQNLIKDYTYKVPFLGDLDAAYQDTFNLLVKDLSNGQNLRVSVIEAQRLFDEGMLDRSPY